MPITSAFTVELPEEACPSFTVTLTAPDARWTPLDVAPARTTRRRRGRALVLSIP